MRTPRTINTVQLADGAEYWHQGVATCLRGHFRDLSTDLTVSVNVNIDGLPIFNSATKCFWPILVNVHEFPELPAMTVGVFYGAVGD